MRCQSRAALQLENSTLKSRGGSQEAIQGSKAGQLLLTCSSPRSLRQGYGARSPPTGNTPTSRSLVHPLHQPHEHVELSRVCFLLLSVRCPQHRALTVFGDLLLMDTSCPHCVSRRLRIVKKRLLSTWERLTC